MVSSLLKLKIFSDGGARGNPGPAASAFVVFDNGEKIYEESKYLGVATNNIAEYKALLMALRWFEKNKTRYKKHALHFYLDSQLVVRQLNGRYKIKSPNIKPLVIEIKNIEREIGNLINYTSVPREKNKISDALVNMAIDENS
jgi:ribonuclease HI